jgi:Cu-processing system ATP-binding protein
MNRLINEPTVVLDGVAKSYGRQEAVRDVSFTLRGGETVALVGHNGAGKTTLMKLMLGLIRSTKGTIRVLGRDPRSGSPEARAELGYLPENVAFNGTLTGRELLDFYARLKNAPRKACAELLASVGLEDAADRRVGTYSKGMRQRLGLAQALLGEPRLLLLDEPTTGLDPSLRLAFYDIVTRVTQAGSTVLLASHALTELEERADRVVIMHRGRLTADGTISELRNISNLPVRMRLAVNGGWTQEHEQALAGAGSVTREAGMIALTCPERSKMDALRRVAAMGPVVHDVHILPPSLDELYAHFLRGEGPQA